MRLFKNPSYPALVTPKNEPVELYPEQIDPTVVKMYAFCQGCMQMWGEHQGAICPEVI